MALATYSDLQASVATWANRSDLPVADLIALTEARFNRDVNFRQLEPDIPLTGVLNSRFIPLPTQFSEPRTLWIEFSWGREQLRNIEAASMLTRSNVGRPYFWTIDNSNIAFERPLDQVYSFTLRMTQQVQLSNSTPTNYVLTNYPDLYLYGTLVQAALWSKDDDQLQRFEAAYQQAVDSTNQQEARSQSFVQLNTDDALRHHLPFNIFSGEPY
jgi:hypothetical protein